jgi:hypothetical protein
MVELRCHLPIADENPSLCINTVLPRFWIAETDLTNDFIQEIIQYPGSWPQMFLDERR